VVAVVVRALGALRSEKLPEFYQLLAHNRGGARSDNSK
jgi:hypothetical protein